MNKKFLTGTIFGVILGLSIGMTLPMIGATDIKMPSKKKTTTTTTVIPAKQIKTDSTEQMKQVIKLLDEINTNLKDNSSKVIEQNQTMIKHLDSIAKRTGF